MSSNPKGGVSRVVMLYREENFDNALAAFKASLGIDDFDAPFTPPGMGLRVAVSWDTGLELIAPHGDEGYAPHMRAQIDAKGEGIFGIVYRVPDLDAGEKRATEAGYPRASERINCFDANANWRSRFSYAMEAPLQSIAGVDVTLIQLDPAS